MREEYIIAAFWELFLGAISVCTIATAGYALVALILWGVRNVGK